MNRTRSRALPTRGFEAGDGAETAHGKFNNLEVATSIAGGSNFRCSDLGGAARARAPDRHVAMAGWTLDQQGLALMS